MSQIHKCGVCEEAFATEKEYCEHICKVSNAQPITNEHLIKTTTPEFAQISESALEKGAQQEATKE